MTDPRESVRRLATFCGDTERRWIGDFEARMKWHLARMLAAIAVSEFITKSQETGEEGNTR